ncbi:Hect e3 ubiquitin, partial [Globisporangium splendens]
MLGFIRSSGLTRLAAPSSKLALGVRAASTVGGALDEAVERLPHKEALRSIKQDLRWSFKELNAIVDEVANGFHSLKFEPGNVLAVWLPNNAESVITQLAAAKAGVTLAVIDPKVSSAEELEYILHDSKASGLLFEPKIAGRNQTEIVQGLFPELATYRENFRLFRPKNFRNLHTIISTGFEPVEGIAQFHQVMVNTPEKHEVEAVKKVVNEKTPLAVSYSKVDGQNPKKGEVLTHGDVLKRAADLAKTLTLSANDKILITGEETTLSFAPVAAIEASSMVVLPSAEYDHEAIHAAQKVEPCNIVLLGEGGERTNSVGIFTGRDAEMEDEIGEQDAPVLAGLSPRIIHRVVAPDVHTTTTTATTAPTPAVIVTTSLSSVSMTTTSTTTVVTSASTAIDVEEDAEAMEQESLLREETSEQQQNRTERNDSSGDGTPASTGGGTTLIRPSELDWDVEEDGWMPKPARLHSGKSRSCAVCFAPLQYTTMQSWDEYLQSEEYLQRLQESLLDDTFISDLICGDPTGSDLPTEHRMHKNRKMKCRQSVHDYLNMVTAGVVDKSGKEKGSIRTLEEMLLNVLPTPVFTHVIERRLAVISHSSRIACTLLQESRVHKTTRSMGATGSNIELHHLAIHTLSALLSSFDYTSEHAQQSFEEMSRLLTCFPALSLYSFWSPKRRCPEKPLVLKSDMVYASSCSMNPRAHPPELAIDDAEHTFWLSQQRPGVTYFVIRHPDVSRISSIEIRWHLKCFPQRVAIECRVTGGDKYVQVAEEHTTAVKPPEYFSVRFPESCTELRITMSGVPPVNRNGTYGIEQIRLNVPCSNSLFVEPTVALNDVANWLLGAIGHCNEDVVIEAIGALKAWALATASLSTTLLFVRMLLDFSMTHRISPERGLARFAVEQGFLLYGGIKTYRTDESEKLVRGEDKKKTSESRKIRALFEPSVCSAGVTVEDAGLTVRTRETSYQYAAVNIGITTGKASWKFRLDNDTVDDEMTCFGAAILPVTVSGYDSSPNLWMLRGYNGNLYARGHKLSRSIGKVHPGDIVQIEVDMAEGTLAYKINDIEYGVVFTDLAGHEVYPAVSFYGSGKVITLLGVQKWDDSDSGAADIDPVYLSNIREYHYSVGYGTFGKGNQLGYASDADARNLPAGATTPSVSVHINGEPRQRCLSTHPPSQGEAFVIYDLGDAYNRFVGAVGINDDVQNEILQQRSVSVVFSIIGDGKELWHSKPVSEVRQVEKFDLSVRDVRMLELKVTCSGSNHCAHAIWIDPCVYPLEEWICTECSFGNKGGFKMCTVCRIGTHEACQVNRPSELPSSFVSDPSRANETTGLLEQASVPSVESVLNSSDPFLELGTLITNELHDLSCLTATREKPNLLNGHVRRPSGANGRSNLSNLAGFEQPFSRQPCEPVFSLLLAMLRRFQVDFHAQSPVGESSVVDPRTILSKQMCIHILGLFSANLESIDLYEVGDLEPELGITPEIVGELRHELERAASVRDHEECRLPKEIQVAAAKAIISGVSVLYSSPSDKLNLLLYLLRSHTSAEFEPDSARHLLLSALMRILASPGKEGILNFLPFLSATMFNSSNGVSIGVPFAQEIIGLLVQAIQRPEHRIEPPSLDNRTAKDFNLVESRSLAQDAMLLLKAYQLFLLAEAVSLTKSKRSDDADLEALGGLDHSDQSHRRALVQESTLQYGFLLLRACRDVIESLVVEQTENSFLQSPAVCELQANIRTHNIPILSGLLPWFVSCLCLLRRQTWLARPILPAICRLLGSFDQYCSELHVVNKSDSRFRKLELHEKARMIESQELDRVLAVDKSLVVNRQASKQMYNVFKQLYTGDKDHFEGQIGFQFEATSTFLVVALGRSVNPAKNGGRLIRQHTVRLWEEASQTLVAQVTVSGTSKKDSMGYALEPLVAPVKLSQGKLYRLTTQEFANGGDPWYKKENLPDEEYDSSYIKILRDCYASGSTSFPNSQNLSGAAYGVPTFLVEGENPVASIPRFASPYGSLSVKFNAKRKVQSVSVSHSGTSAHLIGESASWRNCFLQTAFYQGVHSVDFIVKSARVGGTISGHICIGVDWALCSEPQPCSSSSIKYESFLGETQNSIGWMPSIGALWVCGKRASYGTKLSLASGDILTLVIDYDMQTLSFAHNGQRMGVAVGLPELCPASSSLMQLPEALTPGVSIYGSQDTVQIRPSGIAKSTLRIHWLYDLHNSLSSLAGRVASTLIAAHPVDGVEEELLPWLQSPLLSGGILSAASGESGEPQDNNALPMDWKSALQYEYSMYPSNPALRSDILGGSGTKETGSSAPVKRHSGNSNLYSDDSYAIRQGKFFENLSQNRTESGPVRIILNWLETRSPDRSFLSRLGKFPHCERLTCVALIKHAPAHVLHEVQAIVAGSESSHVDPTKPSDLIDHSNLEPSEDLLLVWKRIVSLRHWLIKTRQEYRAKAQDDSTMTTEFITLDSSNATGGDGDDGISFEKTLSMPKTFDDLMDQVCQRAEFLCLLDPPSEEKDKLGVDSQVALSNLAEKWSSQKTPPSLQPMLERWKSLREADSSKWSGIVDVLRAQDRWRSRRASVVTLPANLNEDKPDMSKATAQAVGEPDDDDLYRRRRYHYKDSFSAMMKACDLYIRNGIGAPPVVLRALLERRQKRSDSRLFGLHAMKTILSILSFDTARHNAIIFLRPALRGFTDDEKESRELNDGQVVTETFRATVRHHYLKGLEGCNRPTIERVQLAFCDLYSFLAQLLNSSSTGGCSPDSLLKHALLCAWSLDFEPRDHPFLLKTGILTTLHDLFSIESSRRDAAADLAGMKVAARAHLGQVSTTANALEYTTINWHPLSEEFVQQSVLHTGYVTKRDILRLLLRAPPYACTKAWWKQNGLEFIFEANGSASASNARHTASSMALLYAELLKKLEVKLSWCQPHLLGRKVLQFGMTSAIQGAMAGQSKPEEISYAETPALGEVQDFCVETWVYPADLSGYRSLRSDKGFQNGSVFLEFADQHLQLGILGNFPREQLFTSYRFRTHEWTHIAVSYRAAEMRLTLFVNGSKVEERFYERVCKSIHFRAARIGCWVNEIDAHGVTTATASPQRSFKGSIAEMRVWCTPRTGEQIQRDFQRSIPYEIQAAPVGIGHDSENPQRTNLLALWHLNEGEGVCGYDRSPSLVANGDSSIAAAENAMGRNADISGCHWAKMNVPVVSNAVLDVIPLPKWETIMRGIVIMQRKVRALCHLQYRRAVKSSRLVCQYEESLFAERWSDLSDEDDGDEGDNEGDVGVSSSSLARNEVQELDSKAKELVKEWSVSTDQQILLKKQTKRCAWIVFRFLATIGIGGVYERREGEAKSVAAIAKMKRKQKLQKGDSISELGSPMHQRMVNQGKSEAARTAGLSYEEEDRQTRTIEAASDAAKTAATNRELEEPVLQTLWFSQELHRKVFEVIERELVLGTTLIQDAEGLTRAQRMLRSLSTPVKRKGETLRSHTSGVEGSRVKIVRPSRRMPSDLASQGEVLETLEVEMYTFAMLGFVLSLSGSSPTLHHLSKPKILRELLELLRTGSPRSQRVVKLLLRKVCSNGVVTPAHVSSLLGSESVLVDLLLDQVAESVCSTAAPLSTPSVGTLSTSSSESSNQALLAESLSNPMGFKSGQIYLVLASESVALLRLLLKEKSWQARVAELLCSAIRNVAPVLTRRKSESSTLGSSESSDIRIRAAIIRAVGALCVLGSHSDCIRIGGRVEVTAKENRAGQANLDYGFNFSDRGAEPALATLIELNSRTSTVRVVFDASSEEFDPSHNVQEVNLSSLSPIEEIRLPSDVIPLTMDMMPVILKLSSLEESSIMASFDDLWRMQVRSRALLALEAILRHSIQMTANVAHKHISKSLLKSALTPVCLNTFVSLPFLQERGRMILGRLIESSTPLGNAMFRGLDDPKPPAIADPASENVENVDIGVNCDPEEEESEEYRLRRGFASTLAAMGFEFDLCMTALEHSRNDPNLAGEWLIGGAAAAYQERQQAQRAAAASLQARQANTESDGSQDQTLEAKARELESISGMPYCLAFCALELSSSDPNRAMEWLMEHGSHYADTANTSTLLSDSFVTEEALALDDRAALEDIDQSDPLVTVSNQTFAAPPSTTTVATSASPLVNEPLDTSDIMAVTLAPILAPATVKQPSKKINGVKRDSGIPGFAPLDPDYLTPHVLLSVSTETGPVQRLSASGRTGIYRRYIQEKGILITFLNTETGAYEDEWHLPQDVRRITKIYDEEIRSIASIHRVALRTENALATHYARRAVTALLGAGIGTSGVSPQQAKIVIESAVQSQQQHGATSNPILNVVGGPRQFVSLLKLVVASEMVFSRGQESVYVRANTVRRVVERSMSEERRRQGATPGVANEESGSILQRIQEITLQILDEEACGGKFRESDWLRSSTRSTTAPRDSAIGASVEDSDQSTAIADTVSEMDEDLRRAIAMPVQDSAPATAAMTVRFQDHIEETKEDGQDGAFGSTFLSDSAKMFRARQPSYTEAQEVATEYLGGGVDDHDGLLSSVLVKECVSHFVESTRVAGEGLSNGKMGLDSRIPVQEYQSLHPYFGRCEYARAVSVDRSFRCLRVVFDHRCKLGPKAKLAFYSDPECEHRILLVDTPATAGGKRIPDLVIHSHQFWFRFIATEDDPIRNHGYGYRFQVKPVPSICWAKEEEVLMNPSLEWACWVLEFLLSDATELVACGAVHNRKIYGALVRYLRSPGAPFKSRVVRLLLQLLYEVDLFPLSETPDLEALQSIGNLALARAKNEKESGKLFISAHLLQLVELSMMTAAAAKAFEARDPNLPVRPSDRPIFHAPLSLPAESRHTSEILTDLTEMARFLLGESSTLPQHILVSIWLDTYESTAIIESSHPYPSGAILQGAIDFAGAQSLLVTFDSRCATKPDAACLQLMSSLTGGRHCSDAEAEQLACKRYSGYGNWPTGAIEFPGDTLQYSFVGDDNTDAVYGINLSVMAVGLSRENQLARASVAAIERMFDKLLASRSNGGKADSGGCQTTVWTSAMDLQLVDWVNNNVEGGGLSSVDLRPSDVRLHHTLDGLRCSLLLDLPREDVELRFALLKSARYVVSMDRRASVAAFESLHFLRHQERACRVGDRGNEFVGRLQQQCEQSYSAHHVGSSASARVARR